MWPVLQFCMDLTSAHDLDLSLWWPWPQRNHAYHGPSLHIFILSTNAWRSSISVKNSRSTRWTLCLPSPQSEGKELWAWLANPVIRMIGIPTWNTCVTHPCHFSTRGRHCLSFSKNEVTFGGLTCTCTSNLLPLRCITEWHNVKLPPKLRSLLSFYSCHKISNYNQRNNYLCWARFCF
jgi:hypothetical protein